MNKKSFLLLKKLKTTESAQLWLGTTKRVLKPKLQASDLPPPPPPPPAPRAPAAGPPGPPGGG